MPANLFWKMQYEAYWHLLAVQYRKGLSVKPGPLLRFCSLVVFSFGCAAESVIIATQLKRGSSIFITFLSNIEHLLLIQYFII